jgi:hypothetical protein
LGLGLKTHSSPRNPIATTCSFTFPSPSCSISVRRLPWLRMSSWDARTSEEGLTGYMPLRHRATKAELHARYVSRYVTGLLVTDSRSQAACQQSRPGTTIVGFRTSDGACACATQGPPANYVKSGNPATCNPNSDYDQRAIATSFTYVGCYGSATGFTTTSAAGYTSCLSSCRFSQTATFKSDGTNYLCGCADSVTLGNPVTCGVNAFFVS